MADTVQQTKRVFRVCFDDVGCLFQLAGLGLAARGRQGVQAF